MNLDKFLNWYSKISQLKIQDSYTPHKPLTILYAISKALKGYRWINYQNDRKELESIISNFSNKKSNCLYPLHRLCNDSKIYSYWIESSGYEENSSGDISIKSAIEHNYYAGFSEEVFSWIKTNKHLGQQLIEYIIDDNFPETLHEDLLTILGIDQMILDFSDQEVIQSTLSKIKRDPNFPKLVMQAYDYRCCFCGLKIFLNTYPLPMEAAHIKWKARGGDCVIKNGLSLCPTHHYTLDKGIWTLDQNFSIIISPVSEFDEKTDKVFRPFEGKKVTDFLINSKFAPEPENLEWHRKSIFKFEK